MRKRALALSLALIGSLGTTTALAEYAGSCVAGICCLAGPEGSFCCAFENGFLCSFHFG